ncbi:hypothetical protein [Demequina flava]|uniref:hypothetical protein n=1 Tax=Demequina flava TaxID=1095025 RepID=UPI000784B750|nr:hypothetical protein [Demequina flava]
MAENKINARKYAAVALGIVGIAGLSLASAAQLTVNEDSPLVGVSDSTDCDDAVFVAYETSFGAGGFTVDSIEVSGIASACAGEEINVYVLNDVDTQIGTATGIADATGAVSLTPAATIDAEAVYEAAVSIN